MRGGFYGLTALLVTATAGFNLQPVEPEAQAIGTSTSVVPPGSASIEAGPDLAVAELAPAPRALRVALQAGHWKAREAPDELAGLRDNGGTRGGGKNEWEVNLEIAELTAALLVSAGYEVEVLPATVPQRYRTDLFIAIHADGNNDSSIHGYRVAAPRQDATRRAQEFADVLAGAYGEATGVRHIGTVTRRMQGYYAFNSRRYSHAIHPTTVGVIIETGFLTSPVDQAILVGDPGRSAQGIYEGVVRFLGPAIPGAAPGTLAQTR